MRLINARTLKLEEVWDENVKKYAILSHRWEDGEVTFQDMENIAVASKMKGFEKIQKSCEHAIIDGLDYAWVDTCCINKESSAELTEAINSMYRWYKASAVCYAFLSDVYAEPLKDDIVKQQIRSSRWFTRGWTLQELVAPQHVVFYNQQWEVLGTKQTLSNLVTLTTGIDEAILNGESLFRRSIAQRMSWASQRVTTRIEDIAYCLLGIFDVNMPMLYGEGEKAFLRLQEHIIQQSDDHTIFAWPIHRDEQPGLLADSPAAFSNCQYIKAMTSRKGRSSYSLTNRGLSIKLMATQFTADTYIVRLDCTDGLLLVDDGSIDELRLGMFLRRLSEDDQYARVQHEG
ncbi:HET-domain-containing protein, partial [Glonium stellatum]